MIIGCNDGERDGEAGAGQDQLHENSWDVGERKDDDMLEGVEALGRLNVFW
jgi:hypothetical protein